MIDKSYIQVSRPLFDLSEACFPNRKQEKDKYRFMAFCALLTCKTLYRNEFRLSSKLMKSIYSNYKKPIDGCTCRYARYINLLRNKDMLIKVKNYGTSIEQCYTYKLTDSIIASEKISIGIIHNKDKRFWHRYFSRIYKMSEFERQTIAHIKAHTTIETRSAFLSYLRENYPTIYSQIDHAAPDIYEMALNLAYSNCIITGTLFNEKKQETLESLNKTLGRLKNAIYSLVQMESEENRTTIDKFGYRLHSHITSMNKFFRNLLRTPLGDSFHEIDAVNCQPFLIGVLLKNAGYEIDERYVQDTKEGSFNDLIASKMGTDRKEAKAQLLKHFFFAKSPLVRAKSKAGEAFRKLYPMTFGAINDFTKNDCKRLCREAQRMESKIFVERVYGEILERNIPAFTIHDCIATTEENIGIVTEMIMKAFYSICGICPTLKTTDLGVLTPCPPAHHY